MQFQSIPSRKYRIRGIKVRIPGAGANRSGTPTVDLQLVELFTQMDIFSMELWVLLNGARAQAWCYWILLLDTRYGFGNHITDSSLDLFSFVTASKFANTLLMMDLEDRKLDSVAT